MGAQQIGGLESAAEIGKSLGKLEWFLRIQRPARPKKVSPGRGVWMRMILICALVRDGWHGGSRAGCNIVHVAGAPAQM